jgi:hypothetical protein
MFYGLLLDLLFYGLGLHYILFTEASRRSKIVIGGLLAASVFLASWMSAILALSIQFLVCAYVLVVYRLKGPSSV